MEKANDLRIGNWLLYSTNYVKVSIITPLSLAVEGANIQEEGVSIKDVAPIPLTHEILTKAGLDLWGDGDYGIRIDEYIVFKYNLDGRYGFWSASSENESNFTLMSQDNRIHYLHQLQNLYHSLTGQELEIKL